MKEDAAPNLYVEDLSLEITEGIVADLSKDPYCTDFKQVFTVSLQQISTREITATVITKRDGQADEFFFATYRLFEYIDQRIGPIDTIEGQAWDLWWYWHR